MEDLAAVAARIRIVRDAQRKFLRLWRVESTLINPLVDRIAEALVVLTINGRLEGLPPPNYDDPAGTI
jgi:hypothetical protein